MTHQNEIDIIVDLDPLSGEKLAGLGQPRAEYAATFAELSQIGCVLPMPSEIFGDLFALFCETCGDPDVKRFADAVPLREPGSILESFRDLRPESATGLLDFVTQHFSLPSFNQPGLTPSDLSMADHLAAHWPALTRVASTAPDYSSLIPLPHRFIVPGGRFRECYYWDTYFTLLGLEPDNVSLRDECVANLGHLIDRFGFVPNGNRSYYLSRSQPPVFFAAVSLIDPDNPARAFARYLPQMCKEYQFWMAGENDVVPGHAHRRVVKIDNSTVLNRYWDDRDMPRDESYWHDRTAADGCRARSAAEYYREIRSACESGWDFSSRWIVGPGGLESCETTSIIPVDLNSLLFGLECAIEAGARRTGNDTLAREFRSRADRRRLAMEAILWNEKLGFYDDYDWRRRRLRNALTPAVLFPLCYDLATSTQARRTAESIAQNLLKPGGLVTSQIHTSQQWDAPNGWAPLQWIAVDGLSKYGHLDLAVNIASRWLAMVSDVYSDKGCMFEKYDVIAKRPGCGGEYPIQSGFSWTNGVTAALLRRFPDLSHFGSLCPRESR